MDNRDIPEYVFAGIGTQGVVAEEVPDLALHTPRFDRAIQADDLWFRLVFYLAAVLGGDVYDRVRPNRQYPDG